MLEPFLKWAGGKRWLVSKYHDFLPKSFKRYIEPFLGSGAVFFHLLPRRSMLADSNTELINVYVAVKETPLDIHKLLARYQRLHSPKFYYRIRKMLPDDRVERAARFIYLNRTCFNGLYRVNKLGVFNVPMGSKTLVEFPRGYLETVSKALRDVILRSCDFESVIDEAGEGDFVYLDPPYTVMHNANNFIKYNANLFSWDDQLRLARATKMAAERGALIMLSNADNSSLKALYHDFGNHYQMQRTSILSSAPEHRRKTTELLITNYRPQTPM